MKRRLHILLLMCLLVPTIIVSAEGNFDYITVKGPGITGEINISDPTLTGDFFAFANFTQGPIDEPVNPGEGYEIIRFYIVTKDKKSTPTVFDLMYYYPYSGYVYYEGLADGSSAYDHNWYAANPSANEPFRDALAGRARVTWVSFVLFLVVIGVFLFSYYSKPKDT